MSVVRRKTRKVIVGDKEHGFVGIGGDAPVALQTMTSTYTYDIDATVAQINRLHEGGADMVRVAVPDKRDTQALKEIIKQLTDEEMEISYRRRILHGKIDILRAELVNRLRKKDETGELVITGADVQQLTDILAGRVPGTDSE